VAAENKSPSRIALTSWKEIAAFFGREVRTVQRWEVLENLPVYRHLHHRKRSVYAYPKELEEWWRERGTRLAPDGVERWVPIRWAALSVAGLLVLAALWLGLRRQPRHVAVAAPTSPAELGKRIRPHPPPHVAVDRRLQRRRKGGRRSLFTLYPRNLSFPEWQPSFFERQRAPRCNQGSPVQPAP
jgi:hypothetical protein